jgi:hypothetical protein
MMEALVEAIAPGERAFWRTAASVVSSGCKLIQAAIEN